MRFDDNALEQMPHIITLQKRLSIDHYNRATYEVPGVRYRSLVRYGSFEIRNKLGEELIAGTRVTVAPVVVEVDDTLTFLDELPDIKPEHKLTLPDETTPIIQRVDKFPGVDELQHIVLFTL